MKEALKISKAIYIVSALLMAAYVSATVIEHETASYLAFASALLRAMLIVLVIFQFATMVSTLNDRFIKPSVVGLIVILFVLLTEGNHEGHCRWPIPLF